jgi:uncharacterized RmlC-like cupin family protein
MPDVRTPSQSFTVSHLDEADFRSEGLRDYAAYRDLGVAKATGGLATASVIRMIKSYAENYAERHQHNVHFQMIYVLKGTYTAEFDGIGTHTMQAGSNWVQPPNVPHRVLHWSDDCELLEVVLPADFETTVVDIP